VRPLDLAIVVGYLAGVVAAGVFFARRQKTTAQYFLGGRQVPWWAISASIVKTGGAGSNTQSAVQSAGQAGSTALTLANPQSLTLTENAAIAVAVTIDCATAASDAALWRFRGEWAN